MRCRTTTFEESWAPSNRAAGAIEHQLDDTAALCEQWKTRMWSVSFLVVTGRALANDDLKGEEYERIFEKPCAYSPYSSSCAAGNDPSASLEN